jgi:hypothetical protein
VVRHAEPIGKADAYELAASKIHATVDRQALRIGTPASTCTLLLGIRQE